MEQTRHADHAAAAPADVAQPVETISLAERAMSALDTITLPQQLRIESITITPDGAWALHIAGHVEPVVIAVVDERQFEIVEDPLWFSDLLDANEAGPLLEIVLDFDACLTSD